MTVGYILSYLVILLFPTSPYIYYIIAILVTLVVTYLIGSHVAHHYGLFLGIIIFDLVIAFQYFTPFMVKVSWQLPVCVFLALISIYIVDLAFHRNHAGKLLKREVKEKYDAIARQLKFDFYNDLPIESYEEYAQLIDKYSEQLNDSDYHKLKDISEEFKTIVKSNQRISESLANNSEFFENLKSSLETINHRVREAIDTTSKGILIKRETLNSILSDLDDHIASNQTKNEHHLLYTLRFEIKSIIDAIETINKIETSQQSCASTHHPDSKAFSFPDWNKSAAFFSLRTTVGIAITPLLLIWFGIPGLYQVIIACLVMVITPNINELMYKTLMRLLGIISGGIAGVLISNVGQYTHSFPLVIGLFTLLLFVIGRLGLKYHQYEYAAIQAGMILSMILFAGGYGHENLELGYERLEGLFSGALIGLVVNFIFNPKLPKSIFQGYLAFVIGGLQKQARALSYKPFNYDEVQKENSSTDGKISEAIAFLSKKSHIYPIVRDRNKVIIKSLKHINDVFTELEHIRYRVTQSSELDKIFNELSMLVNAMRPYYITRGIQLGFEEIQSPLGIMDNMTLTAKEHISTDQYDHIDNKEAFGHLIYCLTRLRNEFESWE
ncbi:FUSC family protein [Vibrio sp. S4M6]|uniref:FUSC family protein n=1 Tax=Vibrio sinus TaxID=2946865 RepID=UPI00202A846C|nr:FUSC family protein [Vibrio sinus]